VTVHDHSRFGDEVGAYLLGALEPDERVAFEHHLASCADCRLEVDELAVAVDALPRSVEQVAPPPTLKASLMASVRREARGGGMAPSRGARWREQVLRRPAFAAAAAVALLALGVGAGALVGALSRGGDEQQVLRAQVDQALGPGAVAELVRTDGDAGAILRVSGMRQPPPGQVYEVWLRRGKRVERSSLFDVARDGSGAAGIPERLDGVDEVLVTREPAGGSDQPSEQPLMRVSVSS
jgi:anti-sigma-K factor RskA